MWFGTQRLLSPPVFYRFAGRCLPWLYSLMALLLIYGVIGGLYLAPADYQQGEGFRIIYVHVPSAILSMSVYAVMAVAAVMSLVWRIKLADVILTASLVPGAWFTALALLTGSLWGKPMWGTWWIWDARLTSELLLLFLYFGVIALQAAVPDRSNAARASALLVLVGAIDLPIIHYSVDWWNTLHQGATLELWGNSNIAPAMLHPLLAMIAAFFCYYAVLLLIRARTELLWRERRNTWVREVTSL